MQIVVGICLCISFINFIRRKKQVSHQLVSKRKGHPKINVVVGIILVCFAVFTRLYKIEKLLNGLHVDEVGMGYDAFCIANYGVDRYLHHFPVYMINFGGGQSALYTYLAAIMVKILGLNTLAIRLPGVILSLTSILAGFFLIQKTHGVRWGFVFMLLMIICPWHVMQSRFGLDCNLLSSMIMISITLLVVSKKWWQYILAGVSFGITLYTYALSYIILPVFLLFSSSYMFYVKKARWKDILFMAIPIVVLAIPLICMLLVNMGYLEQIDGAISILKLPDFRTGELNFNNIWGNLGQFFTILTAGSFVYNAIPQFGTIYLFAIPLAIVGIGIAIKDTVISIQKRKFSISCIFLFLWLANMVLMLLTSVNVNKINSIYIALLYFVFLSLKNLYHYFKIGFVGISILYLVVAICFFQYYFCQYEKDYPQIDLVNEDVIPLSREIQKLDKNKTVYMHLNIHQPWIYVLYALQISPYEFNEGKRENTIDGWNNNYAFDRYEFELPEEVQDNSIYVICEEETEEEVKSFIQELEEKEYQVEHYGRYGIYYETNHYVDKLQ